MTRINIHVPPINLCNEHLIAEHRELKRIPNAIKNGTSVIKNIPSTFRLGEGHVKFFYNKLGYLKKRYSQLHSECIRRNFEVQDYSDSFKDLPEHLFGDLQHSNSDRLTVEKRIEERLGKMKNIHYLRDSITAEEAIKILKK